MNKLFIVILFTILVGAAFFTHTLKYPKEKITVQASTSTASALIMRVGSPQSSITPINSQSALVRALVPEKSGTVLLKISPLTERDWIPNLSALATKEITRDARWSDILQTGLLKEGDILKIPKAITVTYDGDGAQMLKAIVVEGALVFDPAKSTHMTVGTIAVLGSGKLVITPGPGKTAEIVIRHNIDKVSDPAQMLGGIVALGGQVIMSGEKNETPFVQVTGRKGSSELVSGNVTRWKPGDEIFIAGSQGNAIDPTHWTFNVREMSRRKPFREEWEIAKVVSVREDKFILDRPLVYNHEAYAANLSRAVTVKSEAKSERGHVMLAGNVSAKVENVRLKDLGRTSVSFEDNTLFNRNGGVVRLGTNEEGRYSLHAHHLSHPFSFSGNVIDGTPFIRHESERAIAGSPKWGIVNHDSFGSISKNVVIGAAGSGIVGEDGTETGFVENNLVIGTGGGSGDNDDERFGVTSGSDMGHGGFGYWFRGPFMNVKNNIAIGHFNQTAYLYFLHPGFSRNSLSNAAWIPEDIRGKARADLMSLEPVREFSGNKATGYFGQAAFMVFYSGADNRLQNSELNVLGNGETRGISTRHTKRLIVANSTVRGSGIGKPLESSPETEAIDLINTVISGFNQ